MGQQSEHLFKKHLSSELYWVRGVAIILVVMSHVIGFTKTDGMRALYPMDLPALVWIAERANSTHMPVFFAISGLAFFIFSKRNISYQDFFFKKATRLLVPLIAWSPLYFIFQNLYKGNAFSGLDVLNSILSPYAIFWFLHALVWITLFTFIYFKLSKSLWLYSAISLILFILSLRTESAILRNGYWNLFYAVGLLTGAVLPSFWSRLKASLQQQTGGILLSRFISILLLAGLIGLLFSVEPKVLGLEVTRVLLGLPAFWVWLAIAVCLLPHITLLSTQPESSKLRSLISLVGKQSLIVYIFHGYFTRAFAFLIKGLPFGFPPPVLYFSLATFLGTFGPIALYYLVIRRSTKLRYLVGEA